MRAAVTKDDDGFEVVTLPDPSPSPDELVVRVAACGVCGSDIKARPYVPAGAVMGHELGGAVVAVGSSAKAMGFCEGETVAVLPAVTCGHCSHCLRGEVAHCSTVRFLGMGTDAGGFAEYAVVPAVHAFRLPTSMPASLAPLVEPYAVGLHGVAAGEVGVGDKVLVIGAGGVGLTTTAWARIKGAERVTAVDPDAARRELAIRMGASDVLASVNDAEFGGYDVVIECVGRPELIASAASIAGARARIVVAGACEEPVNLDAIGALLKELTLRFSVAYRPSDFREVIETFATGKLDPTVTVGPTFGLDRVGEAFELVRSAKSSGRVFVSAS